LEKEALRASGVEERDRVADYLIKLDVLYHQFIDETPLSSDPLARARSLFDWLWRKKPSRYKPRGSYRLNEILDAQLEVHAQTVGNCLGLTLLYNCLLQEMGIPAGALYLENAFGMGPHVLTLLKIGNAMIDIENIFPYGFDYRDHLNDPSRTSWADRELVSDIYLSMGNEFFAKSQWNKALASYDRALVLNHRYEKAHLNRAIVLAKMEEQ
jgi:tetratricopeptide (TPR) repeat protein